jgi:hypothetical protein
MASDAARADDLETPDEVGARAGHAVLARRLGA